MEEDGLTLIEDSLRAAGILGANDNPIVKCDPKNLSDPATIDSNIPFSINFNMPTKKVRPYGLL